MDKLIFETGIKEYEVNGGEILRFNPADPNVYQRFMEARDQIQALDREYSVKIAPLAEAPEAEGEEVLSRMHALDQQVKERLSYVFGTENDFDRILGGVNLLAPTDTGERVITNLFNALMPIIQKGISDYAKGKADTAVAEAKQNRAQRRAKK